MQSPWFSSKGKQEDVKDEKTSMMFDPSNLKAFVKGARRTSSSAEKAHSDSNSDREGPLTSQSQLSKAR
jgi:hypothetical protein